MNKILTSSLVLLTSYFAFAPQAQAMPSWATLNTTAYDGDTSGGADCSMYAAYYLSATDAANKFGGSNVSSIQNYLSQNFSTQVPTGGTAFSDPYYYGDQYTLDNYVGSGYASADYVAIAFYGETAYRVFGAGSASLINGSLLFDSANTEVTKGSVGAWTTVPEPTSALLILLGMAGLALKRKRA